MRRAVVDWLFFRDLDRHRTALRVERNDLVARLDDLDRRARRLGDHVLPEMLRRQADDHTLGELLLSGARAGDQESLSRLDAWMQTAGQREQGLKAQAEDFTAEAEAIDAEIARLARDQARIEKDFEAITGTERRRAARLAQATLALQFVAAATGLIFPLSAKTALAIHLDYYSAVAAITPVLLVAGFVEIALLRWSTGVWAVLSFAVPAVGAGAAALFVLATHHSTPYAYWLTIWGLGATLASLILYVIFHTTTSSGPGAHP